MSSLISVLINGHTAPPVLPMLMLSETKHHKPTHWSLLRQRASSPSGPAPYVEHHSLVLVSLVHLSRERSAKTIVTGLASEAQRRGTSP